MEKWFCVLIDCKEKGNISIFSIMTYKLMKMNSFILFFLKCSPLISIMIYKVTKMNGHSDLFSPKKLLLYHLLYSYPNFISL